MNGQTWTQGIDPRSFEAGIGAGFIVAAAVLAITEALNTGARAVRRAWDRRRTT